MTTPKHTTAPKGAEVPPGQDRVPDAAYSNQPNQAQAEQERLAARELELQEKYAQQHAVDFFLDRCLGLEPKDAELSSSHEPHRWETRARQFIRAVALTPDAPNALARILAADLLGITAESSNHRGCLVLHFDGYGSAAAVHAHAQLLARVLRRTGLLRGYLTQHGRRTFGFINRVWFTDEHTLGELDERFRLGGEATDHERTCWFDLNSSGQIVEEADD